MSCTTTSTESTESWVQVPRRKRRERVASTTDSSWNTELTSPSSAGQLKFADAWSIWYDRGFEKGVGTEAYESDLQLVGSFDCISDFWRYWNSLDLHDSMPKGANLRIFKTGIKPTWEDPKNTEGGRFVFTACRSGGKSTVEDTTHMLEVLLWLLGCQSSVHSQHLNGLVYSRRNQGTVLSVWNTNAKDSKILSVLKKELSELIGSELKYKKHQTAPNQGSPRHSVQEERPDKKPNASKTKKRKSPKIVVEAVQEICDPSVNETGEMSCREKAPWSVLQLPMVVGFIAVLAYCLSLQHASTV